MTLFAALTLAIQMHLPPVGLDSVPSAWIKDAIVYGIKPSGFVSDPSYAAIAEKLPELSQLGINTIWLQPVFASARGGQGYDIVDYFSLREGFGTEDELKALVIQAHELGIRVILDFVPNHTSIAHPFARDVITNGRKSRYYKFYQHANDGARYSSHYNHDEHGFVYYFWEDLVNLNYNNRKVRRHMTRAFVHWVKKLGIDGYRFDAAWGVNARNPQYSRKLNKKLHKLKPGILLLAEDKASEQNVYDLGFDLAYDWTRDTNWVSQWSWQYKFDEKTNHTVFNHPDESLRVPLLRAALAESAQPAKTVRFIENNDLPRFLMHHSIEQTKMAAALLFALPGVPMIYNGQETGVRTHPYRAGSIYARASSIRSADSLNLFSYYQTLINLRKQYPALRSSEMSEVMLPNNRFTLGLLRTEKSDTILVMLNPTSNNENVDASVIAPSGTHKNVRDVLSNDVFNVRAVPMTGYSIRWLVPDIYRKID